MEVGRSEFTVVDFSTLGSEDREIVLASIKARELAYCPYSQFSVGAAVRTSDGTVYTGCNVENASYSLGICAERTAIVKAVSEGNSKFYCIAVSGKLSDDTFVSPCGACRQFISEFAREKDIRIYLVKPECKKVMITSIKELLPYSFSF